MAKAEHGCPQCDKVFTRAQHVHRHLRTHTGEKPYVCRHCNESFQRADMLTRHKTKNHPADEINDLYLSQTEAEPKAAAQPGRAGHPAGDGRGGRYERRSKYTVMATELAREIEEGTSRREAEVAQLPFLVGRPSATKPAPHVTHPYERPSSSYPPFPHPDQASYLPHLPLLDPHFNRSLNSNQPSSIPLLTPSPLAALQQCGIETALPTVTSSGQVGRPTDGPLDLTDLGFPPFDASLPVPEQGDQDPVMDANWNDMLDSWAADAVATGDASNWWDDANTAAHPPQFDQQMPASAPQSDLGHGRESRFASDASGSGSGSSGPSENSSTPSSIPTATPPYSSVSLFKTTPSSQRPIGAVQSYSSSLRSFAASVLSSLPTPSILVQSVLPASNHEASKSSRPLSPPPPPVIAVDLRPQDRPQMPMRLSGSAPSGDTKPTFAPGPSILQRRQSKKAEDLAALVAGGFQVQQQQQQPRTEVKQEVEEVAAGLDFGMSSLLARRRAEQAI